MTDPDVSLPAPRLHPSADVEDGASIGNGSSVWHLAHVRSGAAIGREVIVGRGAVVDTGVVVGDRCKIQNHALLYAPATLGDGVFVGPAVVLTNDRNPRSVAPDGGQKDAAAWQADGCVVEDGASLGARSVVVAGVTIGAWALVGAGSVVTRDVPSHALVMGNPARQVGWVGRAGVRLIADEAGVLRCPVTGDGFREGPGGLEQVEDQS